MEEEWKTIDGYSNYVVSNLGRVKSLNYNHTNIEKLLKPSKDSVGYKIITLFKNGKRKMFKVHRLVAQSFIPNPDNLPQINHKNEIKDDNSMENLEWCDAKYNLNYGTRNSRASSSNKGRKCKEETKKKISEIRKGQIKSQQIFQIDIITNEIIAEFPSISEVKRQFNFLQSHISECCRGIRKQAYGFKWKYKNG